MIAVILQLVCLAIIVVFYNKIDKSVRTIKQFQKDREEESTQGYMPKCRLNELCWVKALERLRVIREDPEVTEVVMVLGTRDGGGHAWIEYKRGDSIIQYDPTTEKVVDVAAVPKH